MAGIGGLQKQVISVPIGGGIDTKNNPAVVPTQKLTLIENGRFVKGAAGQLQARNGYSMFPSALSPSGNISDCQALAVTNGELDVISNYALQAFSSSQQEWVPKGLLFQNTVERTPIVRNNFNQVGPDSATVNDVTLYVWSDQRGGLYYKVLDQDDGTVLVPETLLDVNGIMARVIANGTTGISVVWSNVAGAINGVTLTTAAATTPLGAPTVAISGMQPATPFEVVALGTNYVIAALNASSYAALTLVSQAAFANVAGPTTYNSVGLGTVTCAVQGNGNIAMAGQVYGAAGTNQTMYYTVADPATLAQIANFNHSLPCASVLTMYTDNAGAFIIASVQSELVFGLAETPYVYSSEWSQGFGYALSVVFARGCGLVSAPFGASSLLSDQQFVLVSFISTVQPTFFLFALKSTTITTPQLIGRYVSLNAGAPAGSPPEGLVALAHATVLDADGVFSLAVLINAQLDSSGGNPIIITGIDNLVIDFVSAMQTKNVQLGADLSISGGLPQLYDSEVVTENGFNTFPEEPVLTLLTSQIGIGSITDGNGIGGDPVAQSFIITIPMNQVDAGYDGVLLNTPYGWGEYIVIGGTDAFWFDINGTGTAPTGLGSVTLHGVYIGQNWTALQIAHALGAPSTGIINQFYGGTGYIATVSGNQVTVTATATGYAPRPQTYSQPNIVCTEQGSGLNKMVTSVNCILGSLYVGGQYFTLDMTTTAFVNTQVYVWFSVNGVGSDPAPIGLTTGIHVAILSTDSESGVATKLAAAINGTSYATATVTDGPLVAIQNAHDYPINDTPTNGTIGQGLGTVGTSVPATVSSVSPIQLGPPLANIGTNVYGAVSYALTFEATDAGGQLARSAPSVVAQIYFADYGIANAQVKVQMRPLYLTARSSVDIAVYRTIDDGTILYRVSSELNLIYNLPLENFYIDFQDNVPDATLQSNETCYCQPLVPNSVIANNCPVSYTQAATFQDQMWINDCEDPQLWWFSKSFVTGVQVEYSNEQTWRFDPIAGPTMGALAMDSNLIVFGTKGIWAVNGIGPDSTGAGAPFVVTLISSAVGLRDPFSLVLTPNGIMFMSGKGLYLLDRGLQVHYIGMPVEAYNDQVIVAASVIPDTTEVRFLGMNAGPAISLLYDYQFDQWSTASNNGIDAIVYDDGYYFIDATTGIVFQEAPGVYADNGTAWTWGFTTAWLKPSALQGFARIWKAFLEGFFPATVGLQVQIAYDYNETPTDTFTFTPTNNARQFRVFPSRGPIESVQFTIVDSGTLSTSAKYAINLLDIECGVKKGGNKKLGPNNTI